MANHARIRARLRDDRGFALMEMLTMLPLLVLVLGLGFAFYQFGVRSSETTEIRAKGLVEQRNGIESMTRLIRQTKLENGAADIGVTPTRVEAQICRNVACTASRFVRFDCNFADPDGNAARRMCIRVEASTRPELDTSAARITDRVITRVLPGTTMFSKTENNLPGERSVGLSINIPVATGGWNSARMTLSDSVTLRNATFTS